MWPTHLCALRYTLFAISAFDATCPMSTKRGITVNPYEVKVSKKSLTSRLQAALKSTRQAKPTKPTTAMPKASSMPVRNTRTSISKPTIPVTTSFILASSPRPS